MLNDDKRRIVNQLDNQRIIEAFGTLDNLSRSFDQQSVALDTKDSKTFVSVLKNVHSTVQAICLEAARIGVSRLVDFKSEHPIKAAGRPDLVPLHDDVNYPALLIQKLCRVLKTISTVKTKLNAPLTTEQNEMLTHTLKVFVKKVESMMILRSGGADLFQSYLSKHADEVEADIDKGGEGIVDRDMPKNWQTFLADYIKNMKAERVICDTFGDPNVVTLYDEVLETLGVLAGAQDKNWTMNTGGKNSKSRKRPPRSK